ncbi:MAG: DUF5658 family protein [Planctomycetaceae bacterium]
MAGRREQADRERTDGAETYRLRRDALPPPLPRRSTGSAELTEDIEAPRRPQRLDWKSLLGHLPLESETSAFILVNVLDYIMTYLLLMQGFYEANPIARYFIESWGPVKGMLGFKLTIVTIVCVIAQVVALKRLDYGRFILLVGTVATGGVVVYSFMLWIRHG